MQVDPRKCIQMLPGSPEFGIYTAGAHENNLGIGQHWLSGEESSTQHWARKGLPYGQRWSKQGRSNRAQWQSTVVQAVSDSQQLYRLFATLGRATQATLDQSKSASASCALYGAADHTHEFRVWHCSGRWGSDLPQAPELTHAWLIVDAIASWVPLDGGSI